jgi:hypothetical protein
MSADEAEMVAAVVAGKKPCRAGVDQVVTRVPCSRGCVPRAHTVPGTLPASASCRPVTRLRHQPPDWLQDADVSSDVALVVRTAAPIFCWASTFHLASNPDRCITGLTTPSTSPTTRSEPGATGDDMPPCHQQSPASERTAPISVPTGVPGQADRPPCSARHAGADQCHSIDGTRPRSGACAGTLSDPDSRKDPVQTMATPMKG